MSRVTRIKQTLRAPNRERLLHVSMGAPVTQSLSSGRYDESQHWKDHFKEGRLAVMQDGFVRESSPTLKGRTVYQPPNWWLPPGFTAHQSSPSEAVEWSETHRASRVTLWGSGPLAACSTESQPLGRESAASPPPAPCHASPLLALPGNWSCRQHALPPAHPALPAWWNALPRLFPSDSYSAFPLSVTCPQCAQPDFSAVLFWKYCSEWITILHYSGLWAFQRKGLCLNNLCIPSVMHCPWHTWTFSKCWLNEWRKEWTLVINQIHNAITLTLRLRAL